MESIGQALRLAEWEPFVPHADGMEFAQVRPWLVAQGFSGTGVGQWLHTAIFALDVYQVLVGCGSLVLNLNGRVPDEGAVSEAAMAWTLGKPVVIFKCDVRSKIHGRDNPLVAGLGGFQTVSHVDELPARLEDRWRSLGCDAGLEVACPSHLERILTQGEMLWDRLRSLGATRQAQGVAESIATVFGWPARNPN